MIYCAFLQFRPHPFIHPLRPSLADQSRFPFRSASHLSPRQAHNQEKKRIACQAAGSPTLTRHVTIAQHNPCQRTRGTRTARQLHHTTPHHTTPLYTVHCTCTVTPHCMYSAVPVLLLYYCTAMASPAKRQKLLENSNSNLKNKRKGN